MFVLFTKQPAPPAISDEMRKSRVKRDRDSSPNAVVAAAGDEWDYEEYDGDE